LEHGADPNYGCEPFGLIASAASIRNNTEVVRLLLQHHGADPNRNRRPSQEWEEDDDNWEWYPYCTDIAIHQGMIKILLLLL
jgi:Ankyrin repeat